MYLYLGQSTVVPEDSVLGIFDLDVTSQSKITMNFLRQAEADGKLSSVNEELPKSFTVCESKGNTAVYLSQMNTATLLRRSETGFFTEQTDFPSYILDEVEEND